MSTRPKNKTMRAWAIDHYGGPDRIQLRELPVPKPEPRDVLIRMHGAEVGDWDALIREGDWRLDRPFPLVMGLAGAGTVAETGAEVTGVTEGDAIYVYNYPLRHRGCRSRDHNGAWAEYMLVPASYIARKPTLLGTVQAGSIPIAALTAHEALIDLLSVKADDVVLITAAAGGVGHLAVQIAKDLGAFVIATTSRRSRDFVLTLGADQVIDYTTEDLVRATRARFPEGVHKVLNCAPAETALKAAHALRKGGRMVDLTGSVATTLPGVHIKSDYVVHADSDRLARIARLIDDKRLVVMVEDVVPFENVPEAMERVLNKHVHGVLAIHIP